ncbi:MAG: hypothetical protein WC934_12135 [Acidithiobacillus sp.]|jgi:hypothetical protein|uniref:hypothetical protein n=1 Tax=Acidithiobacillus sp. TaxID=1872118 RepID=UPI00355CA03A
MSKRSNLLSKNNSQLIDIILNYDTKLQNLERLLSERLKELKRENKNIDLNREIIGIKFALNKLHDIR